MLISVVIVSWNNRSELRECLESLRTQSSQNFEIVLIDNHSKDGSMEMVRSDYPEVISRVMETNLGFAEGCNRGIEIAKGDWICTLNSDAVAHRDWIAKIRDAITQADKSVGMFQSKVLFKNNPSRINSTGIVLLATGSGGDRDLNAPVKQNEKIEEIFVPSASAAVYRKEMLMKAKLDSGFFDRSFFMYVEDLDLGWRCRLMGWKTFYLPEAKVHHRYQASSKKWGNKFADLQCRKNRITALFKNGSVIFLIAAVPKTIYDLIVGLRYSGIAVFTKFYKAMREGIRQRESVTRLSTVSRRDIEKRWVTPAVRVQTIRQKHL